MSEARFPRKSGSDTREFKKNRHFLSVLCDLCGETGLGKWQVRGSCPYLGHNGRKQQQRRGFMVNQSLRSRLMFMAILPALLAALVLGGYSLVNRLVDVRDTNARSW